MCDPTPRKAPAGRKIKNISFLWRAKDGVNIFKYFSSAEYSLVSHDRVDVVQAVVRARLKVQSPYLSFLHACVMVETRATTGTPSRVTECNGLGGAKLINRYKYNISVGF